MVSGNSLGPAEAAAFGPFRLFGGERLLRRDGQPVVIGNRALDILIALVERPGEVIAARELIERAWPNLAVEEANLRVQIANLRKALGDGKGGARYIANIPARGYCFVAPIQRLIPEQSSGLPVADGHTAQASHTLPDRLAGIVTLTGAERQPRQR